MNIGIIEICELTHYMVTNALIKTYSTNPENTIFVFTNKTIYKALENNSKIPNVKFIIKDDEMQVIKYLNTINSYSIDRIHYSTVSKFYHDFLKSEKKFDKIYFHIHNIDLWFDNSLVKQIKTWWQKLRQKKTIRDHYVNAIIFLKEIVRQHYRYKLIENLKSKNVFLITLSSVQKKIVSKYIPEDHIIIFPSLIFEGTQDQSIQSDTLRVCIPGSVESSGKDYDSLLKAINAHKNLLKGKVTFDFLGFIHKKELSRINTFKELISCGIDIFYYEKFIPSELYDLNLSKSDIILSNIKLRFGSNPNEGQIKETAAVYNMLRGAKPGLFPQGYILDTEFHSSCLFFNSYDDMVLKLIKFTNQPELLRKLKESAIIVSNNNSPKELYKRLVS